MKHPVFFAVFLSAGMTLSKAETIPYSNDFSGTGANTAFTTESVDSDWNVTSGVYQYTSSNTSYTPSEASLQITNASGANFTMQTQFTVTSTGSVNSNGQTLGFGLFGNDALFGGTNSSTSYYLADFQYASSGTPGTLRILALGDTTGFSASNSSVDDNAGSSSLAIQLGTTYTLKLQGTYSGSTLSMTLGLFDSTGATQIGTSATATDTSALTGTNFGYRNRLGLGGGTASINFDNFSINTAAIPEPSSALLLGCVSLVVVSVAGRGLRGRSRLRSGESAGVE